MVEPSDGRQEEAEDAHSYRLVFSASMALTLTIFSFGSALQSAALDVGGIGIPIWRRLIVNFATATILVCGALLLPTNRLSRRRRLTTMGIAWLVSIPARLGIQWAFGIRAHGRLLPVPQDSVPAAVAGLLAILFSLVLAEYQRRLTAQQRDRARQTVLAASALQALQVEELRVRREVSEGLHGTLQQQLVLLSAHLRRTTETLSPDNPREAALARDLTWVHDELDRLRERDVRDMSRMLYPSGLDLGLAHASRILIKRIPPSIEVSAVIEDSVIAADDHNSEGVPLDLRLLATRILEEGVGNALRHGNAGRLGVRLSVDDEQVLHIVVDDDGSGRGMPDGTEAAESGLKLLRERLAERGGELTLTDGTLGGTRLTATLPLRRPS